MIKVIAFGASTSTNSINKKLATHVARLIDNNSEVLDLNAYEVGLYSTDQENKLGIPEQIKLFNAKIRSANIIVISLAEHNGSYAAAFKNIFDWSSRENPKVFEGKKMLLLSTSPGPRGGLSVLETAASRFPFHGAQIIGKFAFPSFQNNFDDQIGIKNPDLKIEIDKLVTAIK